MTDVIPKVVQQPGHGTKEANAYMGPPRQITIDVQRNELRLHDGRKKGGWRIPNLTQLANLFMSNTSEFGKTNFPDSGLGILTRVGNKVYQLRQLLSTDGITINDNDGSSADFSIGLPPRLDPTQALSTVIDSLRETGFYIITKGTANLPADLKDNENVNLLVVAYNDPSIPSEFATQIAFGAQTTDGGLYLRRYVNAAWQGWQKITGAQGTQQDLIFGASEEKRLWSASDIDFMVRRLVQSIQYISTGNVATAFSINELFRVGGSGVSGASNVNIGAYNTATGDLFEFVASATAPDGGTATAAVYAEVAGVMSVIATQIVNAPAGGGPVTGFVTGRCKRTASGFDVADSNWSTVSSINGAVTGNFRVTVGAAGKAGAHGTRWR